MVEMQFSTASCPFSLLERKHYLLYALKTFPSTFCKPNKHIETCPNGDTNKSAINHHTAMRYTCAAGIFMWSLMNLMTSLSTNPLSILCLATLSQLSTYFLTQHFYYTIPTPQSTSIILIYIFFCTHHDRQTFFGLECMGQWRIQGISPLVYVFIYLKFSFIMTIIW